MSFFQWKDIDLNSGRGKFGILTKIDRKNLSGDVEGIGSNIPIHYHCGGEGEDDGKPFHATYPNELDMHGDRAFTVGDKVRIMYLRKRNKKEPYIVGWEGDDKLCGPNCILIVAKQQESTVSGDQTDFLCFLWDPRESKMPEIEGVSFPCKVTDPKLVEAIGTLKPDDEMLSKEETEDDGPFLLTPIYDTKFTPEQSTLPSLLDLEFGECGTVQSWGRSVDQGGGRLIIKDDSGIFSGAYPLNCTNASDNQNENPSHFPSESMVPLQTGWTKRDLKAINQLEENLSSSVLNEFLGKGQKILSETLYAESKLYSYGEIYGKVVIPEFNISTPSKEEKKEVYKYNKIYWYNNGGLVGLGDHAPEIFLRTVILPFNSIYSPNSAVLFGVWYNNFWKDFNYGKDIIYPPQSLAGEILKIVIENSVSKDKYAQIRTSVQHSSQRTRFFYHHHRNRVKEEEDKREETLDEWWDREKFYFDYFNDGHIHAEVPNSDIVIPRETRTTLLSSANQYRIFIPITGEDPWEITTDGFFRFLSSSYEVYGPDKPGGPDRLVDEDDGAEYFWNGESVTTSIYTMIDTKDMGYLWDYFPLCGCGCDDNGVPDTESYSWFYRKTDYRKYFPITKAVSHPTWCSGVDVDDNVMTQIYAFFPPVSILTYFKSGLAEEEKEKRREEEKKHKNDPIKPGPKFKEDGGNIEWSYPFCKVWAGCTLFEDEKYWTKELVNANKEGWKGVDPREQEKNEKLTEAITDFISKIQSDDNYDPEKLIFFKVYGTNYVG